MPDQEPPHEPIDKIYADAEAMLDDDAARAARRAKVLGAVAAAEAPVPAANAAPTWRRYGRWMAAASVAGLSLLISLQLYKPATPPPEAPPPMASAAPAQSPLPDQAGAVGVAPPTTPSAVSPKAERAPVADAPAAGKPSSPPAAVDVVTEEARLAKASPAPVPAPAPPASPPPPPPSPARQGLAAAPPPPPAATRETQDAAESVVVTGAMRRQAAPDAQAESVVAAPLADVAAMPERLRAAAAGGRTSEIRRLLSRKAPVDAADEAGETALMKAVRGGHADAAKLLLRGGADLDLKNQAGESARSLAAARNDRAMNKALGL